MASSPEGRRYERVADEIDRALRFMAACGVDTERRSPTLHQVDFFTSHEALILGYEEALTRQRLADRRLVRLLGAHALDRRAHPPARRRPRPVPAGRAQPDRLQGRPDATPDEVVALCEALNPDRIPGRLTLITRMGADQHRRRPAAAAAGGPRRRAPGGVGLRPDARQHVHRPTRAARPATSTPCCAEIAGFFAAHDAEGTWPGGVHVELTGEDVTECLGGGDEILDTRPRHPLRDHVRPPPQRPPVARPGLPRRRAARGRLSRARHRPPAPASRPSWRTNPRVPLRQC